jgi:hypothetical protein
MGFSISWIAVSGKAKDEVLKSLSLADTNEPGEANESPVSGAALPGGWYLLFLNDYAHPYLAAARLAELSRGGQALACQVEEHVMATAAFMYADGVRQWDVTHESAGGLYHLDIEGTPPAQLGEIHARLAAEQDAEGGEEAEVDCMFDVPVELAATICGYRHDRVALASGEEPVFTRLVPEA